MWVFAENHIENLASAKPSGAGGRSNANAIHGAFDTRHVLCRRLSCTYAPAKDSNRTSTKKVGEKLMDNDVRWKQRLDNFRKAILQLKEFIEKPELNKY